MPKLDIVIVNWNAGAYLQKCLASLAEAAALDPELIGSVTVVDNASTDGSLAGIGTISSLPVKILRNADNRGFGAACNQGAGAGSEDYILFLNPDAAVSHAALANTVAFLANPEHAGVGICGVRLTGDNGETSRSCSRFPSLRVYLTDAFGLDRFFPKRFFPQAMVEWPHDVTRVVDQIMGAYFCIRRSLFTQLQGFDERFFVYSEEVDLSYRSYKSGYSSVFLADVAAYHRGGVSSGNVKAKRLFYYLRSRMLYSYKHFDLTSAIVFSVATLCLEPVSRLVYASLFRRSMGNVVETVKAFAYLWAWFPQYLLFRKTR
jgi:GT2 family glycosyltransferase